MSTDRISLDAVVNELDAPVKQDAKKKAQKEVKVGQTEGGKAILIGRGPAFRGFVIRYEGGGELPKELQGLWIRFKDALDALHGYAAKPSSPVSEVIADISSKTVGGIA